MCTARRGDPTLQRFWNGTTPSHPLALTAATRQGSSWQLRLGKLGIVAFQGPCKDVQGPLPKGAVAARETRHHTSEFVLAGEPATTGVALHRPHDEYVLQTKSLAHTVVLACNELQFNDDNIAWVQLQ